MPTITIELSGPNSVRLATELRAGLVAAAGPGESVSPVEVERSLELVIAVIGLVFGAVSTAKTVWDWWRVHQSTGVTVKILLADGTQLDLSGLDQEQLESELQRRATSEQ